MHISVRGSQLLSTMFLLPNSVRGFTIPAVAPTKNTAVPSKPLCMTPQWVKLIWVVSFCHSPYPSHPSTATTRSDFSLKFRSQVRSLTSSSFPFLLSSLPCFLLSYPVPPPLLNPSLRPAFSEDLLWSRHCFIARKAAVVKRDEAPAPSELPLGSLCITIFSYYIFPSDCFVPCQPHSKRSYLFSMACGEKSPNFLARLPRPSRIWFHCLSSWISSFTLHVLCFG